MSVSNLQFYNSVIKVTELWPQSLKFKYSTVSRIQEKVSSELDNICFVSGLTWAMWILKGNQTLMSLTFILS